MEKLGTIKTFWRNFTIVNSALVEGLERCTEPLCGSEHFVHVDNGRSSSTLYICKNCARVYDIGQ